MERIQKTIRDLSIEERQEILAEAVHALEGTAREAFVEGNQQFATMSITMAEAIRVNADELARDDLDEAERVLEQAETMLSHFHAAHPYRMVSVAIH